MTIAVVINAPEGIVLAADSRVTLTVPVANNQYYYAHYDNSTKILNFHEPNAWVGVATYGDALIGLRTPKSLIPEFEASLPGDRLSISDFSQKMSDFFMGHWKATFPNPADYKGSGMNFIVAGFDEGAIYGKIMYFCIPQNPTPVELRSGETFGTTWGGQKEYVDRIVQGYDGQVIDYIKNKFKLNDKQVQEIKNELIPIQMNIALTAMSLQDCIDLVLFYIRSTITAQKLSIGLRGCGGPVDVGIITRNDKFKFVQSKEIRGEEYNY